MIWPDEPDFKSDWVNLGELKQTDSIWAVQSYTELQKILNVPSILKLATEMFLKSAVIFKSGLDFSVKPKGYRDGRKSILPPL